MKQVYHPESKEAVNSAIKEFTKDGEDQREFNTWYSPDSIKYLIHSGTTGSDFLRYVFWDGIDFFKQLSILRDLQKSSKKNFCFICKEPGAGENHFVFGALVNNILVIVNPVGETKHQDFYEKLQTVKSEPKLKIYLSTTKVQHDHTGLSSCGPIVVELMWHISLLVVDEVCIGLGEHNALEKNGLDYTPFDLSTLLRKSLQDLLEESGAYQDKIEGIRQYHYQYLQKLEQTVQTDEGWDKILNHPVQVAVNKLITGGIDVITAQQEIANYLSHIPEIRGEETMQSISHLSEQAEQQVSLLQPVRSEVSQYKFIDNPGGGNCGVYAVMNAMWGQQGSDATQAPIIRKEIA